MLRYKFDVGKALEEKGINVYVCKTTKIISQDTFRKIKEGSTAMNLSALEKVCSILDCQPGDLIEYIPND